MYRKKEEKMKKKKLNWFDKRHTPNAESALNQEVGTTIPTIVSDLQEDNVSGYSVHGFKVEPLFHGVKTKDLLNPKFWEQFIEK